MRGGCAAAAACRQALASPRLPALPANECSYDKGAVRAEELADLLQQAAGFAPGQAFHCEPPTSSSSSGSDDGSPCSSALIDPARLRGALRRSLVCVAAFADEQHLPAHQHLAARGLLPPHEAAALQERAERQQQQRQRWRGWGAARPRARRVLVGFARAVGDAALVATVHDVAVLPELRGHGLGRQLLARVVRALDRGGIVDVGLLAPDASRGFFAACRRGRGAGCGGARERRDACSWCLLASPAGPAWRLQTSSLPFPHSNAAAALGGTPSRAL